MMRLGEIFGRWIDILARLMLGWQERRRARRCLQVVQEEGRWSIRQVRVGQEEVVLGTVAAGAALPGNVAREAERCFVVFELSADQVISRHMTVPAAARDLLFGIVRNQIERLAAWRVGQAAYGYDTKVSADQTSLDVRVLIASRIQLEQACSRLAQLGLRVDSVVARERAADSLAPVALWSRLADTPDKIVARMRLIVGGVVAATLCATIIISAWALLSAARADGETEDVAARIAALQRQVQDALSQKSIAALPPAERVSVVKESSPVAVVVIEALSRALPDGAYLTELSLDGPTLRIVGLADDTPSLIAPLERSGHLKDVHFSAPTTRSGEGGHFVFHIEARVEPHTRIEGE
jgi:general secretion pathway protein L